METKSNINVQISRVASRTDAAQFAELAYALGYDMEMITERRDQGLVLHHAVLRREYFAPLVQELPRLVYLAAMASGQSVDSIIGGIRKSFDEWHVQTDVPLTDLPGIGELHYGGHGGAPAE